MTPEQFSDCLAKGLGRTHLYLQEHDAEPYKDAILNACFYNLAYDPQCEGTRTDYLYELVQLTRDPKWFRGSILEALREPDEEMDVAQLMELALCFAREGDEQARQLLYEKCGEYASLGEPFLADSVIHLDGTEGFLYVANRLGEASLHESEFEDSDYLFRCLQEKTGCADVSELRIAARGRYPFVDVYLDKISNQEKIDKFNLQAFIEQPYKQLKYIIAEAKHCISSGRLRYWGEKASETDFSDAAHDLLKQHSSNQTLMYLSIFSGRKFPFNHEMLLPYIWNENERIAHSALEALSQFQDKQIRDLAFQLMEKNYRIGDAIELFKHNYQDGDETLFQQWLHKITDTEAYHRFGLGLVEVVEEHLDSRFSQILHHLYENTPCSLCRHSFVNCLIKTNTLSDYIKREAVFDCDEETRKLVKALKGGEL